MVYLLLNIMVKKSAVSWALYDWANSAFSTTVMAGFFPVFFKQFWSAGADVAVSTFRLGMANSLASVIIAVLAPLLGAIADRGGARKKFLIFFASMGVVMTGSLYFVAMGEWEIAVFVYIMAAVGFSGGNIFYDSLIVSVAEENRFDFVSALGFSLGYLGGGILFALNIWMTMSPSTFGLSSEAEAVRISFVTVALWWAVFSLPVIFFVTEKKDAAAKGLRAFSEGAGQLIATFRQIRKARMILVFLIGYWLYIDGVDTIIRMAVDYGLSLGFHYRSLVTALLITQFVGFPAALAFGKIGEKLGPKTGIYIGISVYLAVTVWGYFLKRETDFYAMAIIIGLVQGGVQSLSRSLYARLIPAEKAAEFFGFYNMLGKFAAVIGPVLMGWTSVMFGNPRYSIFSIGLLFIAGGIFLFFVDEQEGKRDALQMQAFDNM